MVDTHATDDVHIDELRPLVSPAIVMEELPLNEQGATLIANTRRDIANIFNGDDDRLLVVVGPCSIHDPKAALDYAQRLQQITQQYQLSLIHI